jgi:hypothetical protein
MFAVLACNLMNCSNVCIAARIRFAIESMMLQCVGCAWLSHAESCLLLAN